MLPRALFFFSLSLFLAGFGPKPEPVPSRLLMGVLGDSISAATLADIPIPDCQDPEEKVRKWNEQATDQRLIYTNKRRLSWGSGTAIRSHHRMLKDYLKSMGDPAQLEVLNLSHPGDSTRALPGQARRLVEAYRRGDYSSLKYVVLTIGSNDACDSKPEADLAAIRGSILGAMAELARGVSQQEPIRVLVVGAPRIPLLGVPEIQNAKTAFGLDCRTVRNGILRFCNRLTTWKSSDELVAALAAVERVNSALESAVHEVNAEFPKIRMVYSGRLYQSELALDLLAVDCFHPSARGQEQIALQTWGDQPWFH